MQAQEQATTTVQTITDKLQTWGNIFIENLPNIAIAILVLLASFFISKLVYKYSLKVAYTRVRQTSVATLIARIASVVVVVGGLFLALSALNLSEGLKGLLAGASISGLVIGLALQGTLSNTIAGILLSVRKNIEVGHWVETSGYAGEVSQINLNNFVIKEADNNYVIIPNKTIIENPIKNFSLTTKMRIMLECGVGYESDLEQVRELTIATIKRHFDSEAIEEDVEFYFTDYGASSINFLTRFWIIGKSGVDKLKAKSTLIIELTKAFNQHGINIPFPIRTLKVDEPLKFVNRDVEEFSHN